MCVSVYAHCVSTVMDMRANTLLCAHISRSSLLLSVQTLSLELPQASCPLSCPVWLYNVPMSLLVPSRFFFNSLDAESVAGRGQSKVMNNFPLTSGKNFQSELQAEDGSSEEPGLGCG